MGSNPVLMISVYLAIGITGLSILALIGFGIRNLTYGKVEPLTIGAITVPVVILGVLFVAMPSAAEAGIMTLLIMFALSLLGLVYTGVKNLIW
jgi:hypothetical protein